MHPRIEEIHSFAARAVPEEASSILTEGLVAHVGFVDHGVPHVIPMNYQYDPSEPATLYLHGGHKSRLITTLQTCKQACVTVTLLDGIVFSKSARFHSMNYRSVVCYGHARPIEDVATKAKVFEGMTARLVPGRTAGQDYQPVSPQDLDSTAVLRFQIESWSAKARRGGPRGPHDGNDSVAGSSGVVELRSKQ